MPKNPENKTHHVHAVVTPEAATPDNFLVSRATRKIFSPFGAPLMYSPYAQEEGLCPKRLMPKEVLMPKRLMPKGLCPGGSLCPNRDYAQKPGEQNAPRPRSGHT